MTYIRMVFAEARDARVPQQLLPSDTEKTEKNGEGDEEVSEYSGVGSIMGYMAPLGVSIDNRKSASKKKKKQ